MSTPDHSLPPPETPPEPLLEAWTERLLDAPPAERAAVCEELARRHPEHRPALFRLLKRIGGAERLLALSYPPPPPADDDPPAIGGHRVVRRLGQGAFGTVFLCQQERPVARLVAIKVARVGGDPDVLRRFHAERQLLASLSHPAIAQIHDAGAMPDGRPFFVMEFVDGRTITDLCATRGLDTEQRLRLFVDLCRGVDHAHRRGVVHRDLKPGNVLVVESDGVHQPKIIDFGIAKALSPAAGGGAALTETGRVMGTPGYMSPEQALGRSHEVDARTDVFALGVMLYELLTGDLPWPRGALRETDTEPALPSVRITRNTRRAPGDGSGRRLAARVRGDLDWITLKAVRRERDERYASARELADDVERHLAGRPVQAGPPSIAYRLRKLVRRQRTAFFAFAAAAAVVVVGFGIAQGRTRTATDLASARQSEARAAVERLLQRANDAGMRRTPQNEALRQELAADALAFYEAWLAERPDDAELRAGRCRAVATLSEVHTKLGQVREALRTADEAAADAAVLLAGDPGAVPLRALFAQATRMRVKAMHLERQFEASKPFCERVIAELQRCAEADPGEHGIALAQALRDLALTHQVLGDSAASVAAGRRSIDLLERLVASGRQVDAARQDLVWARFTLAGQLMQDRQFDPAEQLLAAAAADLEHITAGREHAAAAVYGQQGQLSWERGDVEVAVGRLTRAQEACEAWLDREPNQVRAHATLFHCVRQLARALEARGDSPRATAAMQRTIDVAAAKAAAFPEDPRRIFDQRIVLYEFARALWSRFRRGDLARADAWLRRCIELHEAAAAAGGLQRPLPWEARSVLLLVADADGREDAAAWERLAAELPRARALGAEEPAQQVVEAWLGVTRSRARGNDLAGAANALQCAGHYLGEDAPVDAKLRSEASYWRARLALAGGDFDAAAGAVAELLARRDSWWGHWRAGDCEFDAWRALGQRAAPEDVVVAARDRAAERYRVVLDALRERVQKAPDDPWLGVPFGLAALGLAQIDVDRREVEHARTRLTEAVAILARVERDAHRDLWDEARVAAGRELLRRLASQPR